MTLVRSAALRHDALHGHRRRWTDARSRCDWNFFSPRWSLPDAVSDGLVEPQSFAVVPQRKHRTLEAGLSGRSWLCRQTLGTRVAYVARLLVSRQAVAEVSGILADCVLLETVCSSLCGQRSSEPIGWRVRRSRVALLGSGGVMQRAFACTKGLVETDAAQLESTGANIVSQAKRLVSSDAELAAAGSRPR